MGPKTRTRWINFGFQAAAVVAALLFTMVVLVMAGAPPLKAYQEMIFGMIGMPGSIPSPYSISNVLQAWLPLLIITAGLLVTFSTGLWNIGIEGQITMGAIFTTGVLRIFLDSSLPAWVIITLSILAGMVGGILWASLVGMLKTFGGVSEIFGGLGLNFVAGSIVLWLIYGPWGRPGVASLSGTEQFPARFDLPNLPNYTVSLWTLLIGLVSVIIVYILFRNTYIGLRLKAIGHNRRAAHTLGVPTWQYMMLSFMICGAFAGIAGALQVTAVYHRLLPSITSGYGFLGLLVAMLINFQAVWVAPVALFYAALNAGGIWISSSLKLDSHLSGVLQGVIVLFVLLGEGFRQRFVSKSIKDGVE